MTTVSGRDPTGQALAVPVEPVSRLDPAGFDPSRWQPIETAPMDGTPIQAIIPGHGADNIIAFHMGLVDSDGNDCGGWCFVTEQEPPDCWTDGWCWEVNEDGKQSVHPTHWKPDPAVPEADAPEQSA